MLRRSSRNSTNDSVHSNKLKTARSNRTGVCVRRSGFSMSTYIGQGKMEYIKKGPGSGSDGEDDVRMCAQIGAHERKRSTYFGDNDLDDLLFKCG